MNRAIVESTDGITLVGGGPVSAALFRSAKERAPCLVAADSGADRCLALGARPEAVIGDMDSISQKARAALKDRLHLIAEQESTDFDKALRSIRARFVLGLGFMGARPDHELAAYNVLVRRPGPVILMGATDLVFHLPDRFAIDLRPGDRFSLFPMAEVEGASEGLVWPIDGLLMTPAGRTGTSNRVSDGRVRLALSGPGMLCLLPRKRLPQVLVALTG